MRRPTFAFLLLLLAGCSGTGMTGGGDDAAAGTADLAMTGGAACTNQKKDGDETDVDCGGSCPKCGVGKMCVRGADCESGGCLNNACIDLPSMCDDKMKDGAETDVDCGGSKCPRCADGKMYLARTDCASDACLNNVCIASPACTNGTKDNMETDVDCGGPTCKKCPNGKACVTRADCESDSCLNNVCIAPPPGCTDNTRNGAETDVDCGGGMCNPCANGKMCLKDADCQSMLCAANVCTAQAAPCMNQKKDPGETDIDCGGPMCGRCGIGKACSAASDCLSNNCVNNVCMAPPM